MDSGVFKGLELVRSHYFLVLLETDELGLKPFQFDALLLKTQELAFLVRWVEELDLVILEKLVVS